MAWIICVLMCLRLFEGDLLYTNVFERLRRLWTNYRLLAISERSKRDPRQIFLSFLRFLTHTSVFLMPKWVFFLYVDKMQRFANFTIQTPKHCKCSTLLLQTSESKVQGKRALVMNMANAPILRPEIVSD